MIGQGGLMHQHGSVRSRAAYLFSRFVREMTPALSEFASSLLQTLENGCAFQGGADFLSESDRGFVFEAVGYLVNVSPLTGEEKAQRYARMVAPLVERFQCDINELLTEQDVDRQATLAQASSQYVAWAGRTTKCWKTPEAVVSCQAGPILAECVRVFLTALELPGQIQDRSLILQSIRTFLHRMLICLSTDIIVLLPNALSSFLRGVAFKDLHELFPLINQIASKFKNDAANVLIETLPLIYTATFPLTETADPDEDQVIRRDFFSFLHNICKSGLAHVLIAPRTQSELPRVIELLKRGTLGKDPVSAKLCFMVFARLAKEWMNTVPEFSQVVMETIIPSCFIGPASPHVDLKDAQCQMAIVESANCMKELFEIGGQGLINYLRDEYMLGICGRDMTDEYVQALMSKDIKAFRSYTKVFFGRRARN